jgi:hypothetical protein
MTGKGRLILCVLPAFFCLLIGSSTVKAQAVGEITGTVKDPSGAVVPNARITATRTATGVSQSTISSGAGTYTVPRLPVGTYTVTAAALGFKTGVAQSITLDVSQQRQVNFTLALAGVQAKVEVTAAPPLLNTTNGTVGTTVSQEQVQNLPVDGRDITNLMIMVPGVNYSTGTMGWMNGGTELVSNGNRGETMVGTLDGADIADPEMGTLQFTNFNFDAISQFKIQTNDYSAQYGQGGGEVTQVVTKSGTNQFHGSLYEFQRNSFDEARNFFATSVPPYNRNEFGATFGGPIKKDKTFFFVEYGGLRQEIGSPDIIPVPTAAERNGAVTITDANGQPETLQVPLNSVAKSVLSKYPMPNQPDGIDGAETLNLMFSQPTVDNQFSARLDQKISDKDSLFARVSWMNNELYDEDATAAIEGGSNFSESNIGNARNYTLSETHLFSPTLLGDFTFTLNRGIEGVPETPAEYTTTDTDFSDGSLANWGPDSFETEYVTTVFEPQGSVQWQKGRHSLNFGGDFHREWDNGTGVTGDGPSGVYSFNPGTPLPYAIPSTSGGPGLAAGAPSPNGLISFMEGSDYEYERATTAPGYGPPGAGGGGVWWGLRRWTLAGYVQDDIKATRRLTLNVGLRYEYTSVPWEVDDRLAVPDDAAGDLYGRLVLNPQPLWPPDYFSGDFGPRFGMAFDLGHNTVLRGGFGMFTNQIPTVYPDQALVNFPLASENYELNAPYSLTPSPVALPALTNALTGQPIVMDGNTRTIAPNTPVNYAPYAAILGALYGDYPSDRMRNGYTINGNVTLEHEFAGGIEASAGYVQNNGVSLYNYGAPNAYSGAEPQYTPFSDISPGIGELQDIYNAGYSYYSGLQLQARKISPAHGLQFMANYTWGKDMTDSESVWNTSYNSPQNPECLRCDYAPASYSIAQRFVANFEYDLPIGQWQAFSRLPQRLTHGWEFLGIFQAQTGNPFTLSSPYGTLQFGEGGQVRPDFLQRATLSTTEGTGPQFFSNAVIGSNNGVGTGYFGLPTVISPVNGDQVMTTPGTLGVNTFTAPEWSNLDFSIIKDTRITESKTLQFRAEFFNILNEATFSGPGSGLSSPGFGYTTGTATNQRIIQFALRFIF